MLIGEGWDPNTDERQFQRARAQVLTYVKSVCGKDTLTQQQLHKALYQRYIEPEAPPKKYSKKHSEKVSIVDAAIVAGISDLLQRLKARNSGRYTHEDRVLHNALQVTTAAGWKAGPAIL